MGLIRLYLALCVIVAHTASKLPWEMHDGRTAVQIFFIFSGFYMAMVLSTRYREVKSFYRSRFFRIFPPYWVALGGTVILSVAAGWTRHRWLQLDPYLAHPLEHNGAAGIVLAAASNLTLIGQDWVMFLSHDAGQHLHFGATFLQDHSPLHRYLLVPQAWSIGVELTFYAVAPLLNRLRSRWLALLALAAFGLRLLSDHCFGSAVDPWTYRFFPFELAQFLIGMLGYRLYAARISQWPGRFRCRSPLVYALGAVVVLGLVSFHLWIGEGLENLLGAKISSWMGNSLGPEFVHVALYSGWLLGVPLLFFFFGEQKMDRFIGELSYPVYLLHIFVINLLSLLPGRIGIWKDSTPSIVIVSVALAAVFYRWVILPLERVRHAPAVGQAKSFGTEPAAVST